MSGTFALTSLIIAVAAMTPEAPFNPFASTPSSSEALGSRYQDCLELVDEDLEIGRIAAEQWASEGGGSAALHCLAVAELADNRPRLAAVRLMQIAERPDAGDGLIRARYLEQATRAWLEAEELDHALDTIRQAQVLAPNSGELSLTAGLVFAERRRWQSTINAIDAAEREGFVTADGYVARGKANKALSKNVDAANDVVAALSIDPFHLDALVLRGELQQLGVSIDANYQRAPQKP